MATIRVHGSLTGGPLGSYPVAFFELLLPNVGGHIVAAAAAIAPDRRYGLGPVDCEKSGGLPDVHIRSTVATANGLRQFTCPVPLLDTDSDVVELDIELPESLQATAFWLPTGANHYTASPTHTSMTIGSNPGAPYTLSGGVLSSGKATAAQLVADAIAVIHNSARGYDPTLAILSDT